MNPFKVTEYGLEWETEKYYILFGNVNLIRSTYKYKIQERLDRALNFFYVNQTHGDGVQIIKDPKDQPEEADAIISPLKDSALVIKTADCIPLVAINESNEKVAIIHAGWRGVLNDISLKAIKNLKDNKEDKLSLFVGPHIHSQNFQVKDDLVKMFQTKFSFIKEPSHFHKDLNQEGHSYFDLGRTLKDRLYFELRDTYSLIDVNVDTVPNPSFHSHRRDKERSGRNLNIVIKK